MVKKHILWIIAFLFVIGFVAGELLERLDEPTFEEEYKFKRNHTLIP